MRGLSISAAWDQTKAIMARDGQLLITVALAMVALPSVINSLINPNGMNASSTPFWMDCVALVASLIALAGQLALVRLALGPSITVGAAIVHGFRRMPVYLLAILIIVVAMVAALIPIVMLLAAVGMPVQRTGANVFAGPGSILLVIIFIALFCFLIVRLILAAPAASAERGGPIAILRRTWGLTAGHWWPLFGFILIFVIGAVILLVAVASAFGAVVGLLMGPIQPMSAAALILALIQSLISAAITTVFAVMLARIYLQLSGGEAQVGVPSSGI